MICIRILIIKIIILFLLAGFYGFYDNHAKQYDNFLSNIKKNLRTYYYKYEEYLEILNDLIY